MPEPDWHRFAPHDNADPGGRGGVVAAVARRGEPVSWRAWGRAEPDGRPLDLDAPLYAASLAKQLTAACVASLALERRCSLRTPVREVLPWLPPTLDAVELGHLVAHTSGLPDSGPLDARVGFGPHTALANADRLAALHDVVLVAPPGAVHRYSNHGFLLLAEVVSAVASQPFGRFAERRLLTPAGMRSSGFVDVDHPSPLPGWSDGARVEIRFTSVGDGGLVTTVADLLRWDGWLPRSPLARLVLGPRPLAADGTTASDAWGVSIREHRGLRIESHGGTFAGYLCAMVRFPSEGATFIAMSNTDAPGPTEHNRRLRHLADATLRDALDLDRPPWTETHGRAAP